MNRQKKLSPEKATLYLYMVNTKRFMKKLADGLIISNLKT